MWKTLFGWEFKRKKEYLYFSLNVLIKTKHHLVRFNRRYFLKVFCICVGLIDMNKVQSFV